MPVNVDTRGASVGNVDRVISAKLSMSKMTRVSSDEANSIFSELKRNLKLRYQITLLRQYRRYLSKWTR